MLYQSNTEVAKNIAQNLYVDNVLGGCETLEEAKQYYDQSVALFGSASMNSSEWFSNNQQFMHHILSHHQGQTTVTKVLGLNWNTIDDVWNCSVGKAITLEVQTKRHLLQALASVYDPCGFFTPVTAEAKILMQDLWKNEIAWDETLSGANIQLHVFCDASEKAFSAVAYLHNSATTCTVDLLMSKVRVSPLKQKLTVPRLELLAVVIGSRLLCFTKQELCVLISESVIWSDSECALQWIMQENPTNLFVRNRLQEFRNSTDSTFRYVPAKQNPADLPTRGVNISDLMQSSMWWNGPKWLEKTSEHWPMYKLQPFSLKANKVTTNNIVTAESKKANGEESVCLIPTASSDSGEIIQISRFSTLRRLHRITALVFKFIALLKRKATLPKLQVSDIEAARLYWIKKTQEQYFKDLLSKDKLSKTWKRFKEQVSVFKDTEGLLRCKGRLGNAVSFEEKCLILHQKNSRYTSLVIQDCHERVLHFKTNHTLAKTREKYWIIHGRQQVKKVVSECQCCRKFNGPPCASALPPDLPEFRVAMAPSFSHRGLDYIGPLYIRNEASAKVWICLFTCATTRAISLDVIQSLTTGDFLLCLRRFTAMHGISKMIIYDNARQFHAGKDFLTQMAQESDIEGFSSNFGIEWKFITERAPWMGGFYERLVHPVKDALKKMLNRRCVTLVELQTVVIEIASVINSRPLVYLESDNNGAALAPAHFLMKAPNQWPLCQTMLNIYLRKHRI